MKLFTIGDSIAQGFMSGAAARSDLAFPHLIARQLRIPPDDHRFPAWPAGGLPFNLELVFRHLEERFGDDIRGLEWARVLGTINAVVDESEEYYESGAGRIGRPTPDRASFYHNIAVRDFDVADAWLVTPRVCREAVEGGGRRATTDQYLGVASQAFYRTASAVLNPSADPGFDDHTALDWLALHARREGGVENLVLWLGANHALGTVSRLSVRETPDDPDRRPVSMTHAERRARDWNLWHPEDFRVEYEELLGRVDGVMKTNRAGDWKVFLGNVPLVTIAPLAKGVGRATTAGEYGLYYEFYTYLPFGRSFATKTGIRLTRDEALHIDGRIRQYNAIIAGIADTLNREHARQRYWLVDFAEIGSRLAWKRNAGRPRYRFPRYFESIRPPVSTQFHHADRDGRRVRGGLFSLDGIHPTAIGHGILAHEFLKTMKSAGVAGTESYDDDALDWPAIFARDDLYRRPIRIVQELYQHERLATLVTRLWQLMLRVGSLAGQFTSSPSRFE